LLTLTYGYQIAIIEQEVCSELKARAETDFPPPKHLIHPCFCIEWFLHFILIAEEFKEEFILVIGQAKQDSRKFCIHGCLAQIQCAQGYMLLQFPMYICGFPPIVSIGQIKTLFM